MINSLFLSISIMAIVFLCSFSTSAQLVSKVKDKSVLLDNIDENIKPGTEWLTINEAKRKTGWIKIKQVRGKQAVAEIMGGKVFIGQSLLEKPAPVSRFEEDPNVTPIHEANAIIKAPTKEYGGVFLGYTMDTMTFTAGDSNTPPLYTEGVNMTGTNYAIKGFYDNPYNSRWTIRYSAGLDGFTGNYSARSSQINRGGSTTSNVSLSTIALEAEGKWTAYNFKQMNLWLGLGYSFQYTTANSTNLYSLSMSTSYSNILMFGGGIDIPVSAKYLVPIFINYNYYIAGSGITQNSMTYGAGFGWLL